MSRLLIALTIPALLMTGHKADAETGETGAGFVALDMGASSVSMGGAVVSLDRGVHSLFWNPGALGWLEGTEATAAHSEHFHSIRHAAMAVAHGTGTSGIGLSVRGLYVGGMEERTGPSETSLSDYSASFLAPSVSVATTVRGGLSVGTSLRLVYQSVADADAVSLANDIGFSAKTGVEGLRAGAVLTNWGTGIRFLENAYTLPTRLSLGLSYSPLKERLSLSFDLVKPLKDRMEYRLGAEGIVKDRLCLRGGYRSGLQNSGDFEGVSAGVGFQIRDIDLDYAISGYGVLGLTHSFSVSYIFGRSRRLDEEEERRIAEHLEQRAKSTAKAFYRQGLAMQNDGNYAEAFKRFDLALIWDPSYDAALKSLESVGQKMKQEQCEELLSVGIADFDQGNYMDAVSAFGRVLDVDPANEAARGWLETASDALVGIQVEKMRLQKEVEDEISTYIAQGLQRYSRKDYSGAIDRWREVIALNPSHTEARDWIKQASLAINQEIEHALEAIDRDIASQRWTEAERNIDRVLSLDPQNRLARAKREEISKLRSDLSEEHARKGVDLFGQKEFALATAEFTMALDLDEGNTTALEYLKKSQMMEKREPGQSASELYRKGVDAYTREDYRGALVYWQKVLEIDPDHLNAKRNIKRAEEKLRISGQ